MTFAAVQFSLDGSSVVNYTGKNVDSDILGMLKGCIDMRKELIVGTAISRQFIPLCLVCERKVRQGPVFCSAGNGLYCCAEHLHCASISKH